ncbi:MAG: hypothetical protein AAF490_12445 [Chloroflexota bacterium]
MSKKKKEGKAFTLNESKPTKVPIKALYTWVIWQFPQSCSKGAYAAVFSPNSNQGWLPAIVRKKKKQVQIHGHLPLAFKTPEEALTYLSKKFSE